jgi:phosphopantothenoylcysteine decarboxylase/phosphopantothenate--cysteine ligase
MSSSAKIEQMQSLSNKKILLGITGGIAAYKSAELVRLLIKAGAEVRVVMTPSAQKFVQPLTYQALSGHRVYIDLFDAEAESNLRAGATCYWWRLPRRIFSAR